MISVMDFIDLVYNWNDVTFVIYDLCYDRQLFSGKVGQGIKKYGEYNVCSFMPIEPNVIQINIEEIAE